MATCAMCGGKDVTTSCPVCREVRYCDDTCRLADWSSGHARIAARQFCRQLALEGSPVFFLPEGEEPVGERVDVADVEAEAAAFGEAAAVAEAVDGEALAPRSPTPEDEVVSAADEFLATHDDAYWTDMAEKGLAIFPGLRFVVAVQFPSLKLSWMVEGTSENLLLPVVETPDGQLVCLTRAVAAKQLGPEAADEMFRKQREFAEKLRDLESDCFAEMLPKVASSGGIMLIVRFEEPGGRYTAKTHVVQSRAARAPTDMPWWRAALLPAALERLNLEKRKANECLVKSELRSALRGYDSIIDTINVALSAPHVGPCAATQQLFATCLAHRAACRIKVGDVESLQNAEDDCREALEGPWTGWLRAKLEPSAAKLYDMVNERRQRANDALHRLLRSSAAHEDALREVSTSWAAARPTEAYRASVSRSAVAHGHVWLFGDHERDLFLKLRFEGPGWTGVDVADVAPALCLKHFADRDPSGRSFVKQAREVVEARVARGDLKAHRVALRETNPKRTTLDCRLDAGAYAALLADVDQLCRGAARARVDADRGERRRDEETSEIDACPICRISVSKRQSGGASLSRACGSHSLCADCAEHWLGVLRDGGRRAACPVCAGPWLDERERELADPMINRTSLSLVDT